MTILASTPDRRADRLSEVPERVAAAFSAPPGRRVPRRELDADQPLVTTTGVGSAARVGL